MLRDSQINKTIKDNLSGLSKDQQKALLTVKDKAWFKSYARKSEKNLQKILKKVKKGIKHGQFTYHARPKEEKEKERGFQKPKVKKGKKKVSKPVKKEKRAVKKTEKQRTYVPKTKQRVEKAQQKYPDATNYELRHGVNSKASQEYRLRHDRPAKYEGRIKG